MTSAWVLVLFRKKTIYQRPADILLSSQSSPQSLYVCIVKTTHTQHACSRSLRITMLGGKMKNNYKKKT
jgi:hypothetical protein